LRWQNVERKTPRGRRHAREKGGKDVDLRGKKNGTLSATNQEREKKKH